MSAEWDFRGILGVLGGATSQFRVSLTNISGLAPLRPDPARPPAGA